MLQIHTSDRLLPLADHLSEVLATPPQDPMTPEWIATPTEAMHRWLSLQLARRLGAGPASSDGVAANIRPAFPGSLLAQVLVADSDTHQLWELEKSTWTTLRVIHDSAHDPILGPLALKGSGSVYARARRIADLFDRYTLHRPAMIRSWAEGNDTGSDGTRLPAHAIWQPRLWRALREQIGSPSPAEALPAILERLSRGEVPLDLPQRLVLFGLTGIPAGTGFLDLAKALGDQREIHLYLVQPSPSAARAVRRATVSRSGETASDSIGHPLLRSWSRPSIEAAQILASVDLDPLAPPPLDTSHASTTLSRLQDDLRGDQVSAPCTIAQDQSIQFHSCYGPTRQVEALRDSILLLLDSDPTLSEDDIVVLTPALERFAPLVEAVFGPSADGSRSPSATGLRYRIADRSIRSSNPLLAATSRMLDMATGRFDASTVLDFLGLPAVRAKFGFTTDDLASIRTWCESANVRWGLDPEHRARHGVSATIDTNTWQSAVDRLLVGATILADGPALSIGDVSPHGIEGSDADLAGRLAAVIQRLIHLASETDTSRDITKWLELLLDTAQALFEAPKEQSWQFDNLVKVVHEIADGAESGAGASMPVLTFADFRCVLGRQLEGRPGRPDFFRGGVTVTSLRPMRWIPHRVVCVVGLDQSALGRTTIDSDDLMAASPELGDFDPRADTRQTLLEALLSADDTFLIYRDGHDIRTNESIERPPIIEDLIDALAAMIPAQQRTQFRESLEIDHPRQPFDERYFIPGGLLGGRAPGGGRSQTTEPAESVTGFDPDAFSGALARRARIDHPDSTKQASLGSGNWPGPANSVVELDDLMSFLRNPARHHTDHSLQLRLPRPEEEISSQLPMVPDSLERWHLGHLLVESFVSNAEQTPDHLIDHAIRVERRNGSIPPGQLGVDFENNVRRVVEQLIQAAAETGVQRGPQTDHPVDFSLPDLVRVAGAVPIRLAGHQPGPAWVRFSKWKPLHLVEAWLDLMCLVISDPSTDWRAITINPINTSDPVVSGAKGVEVWKITPVGSDRETRSDLAFAGVDVVIDCLRRSAESPVPLFPQVSRGLYVESNPQSQLAVPGTFDKPLKLDDLWLSSHLKRGDAADESVSLLYGNLDLSDLRALPARPTDPGDQGGAAERFAEYFWRAIDGSISIDRALVADP